MAFPFQAMTTDLPKPMRGLWLRMRRPKPVEQCQKMRAVQRGIPLCGVLWRLECQKQHATRRGLTWKWPCMQFVGKLIARRVVAQRLRASRCRIGHGATL